EVCLKCNLHKDVWNKIWNFVKFIHVWFRYLLICNEQFPKSARRYCISRRFFSNGIYEYVINTSNITFHSFRKLSNYYYV
ncbi:hypothetical protein ALC57_04964, partial [Trachymyrmex cornetzi]